MANMVIKTKYPKNPKQIMMADSLMASFGVIVGNEGISADKNGRKILKAGTPLKGDIGIRNTAFTKASMGEEVAGILLHDVDVTAGNANGAIVLFGFVDLEKLDEEVFQMITTEVKTKLNGKITFLTGSGNELNYVS